MADTTMTQRFPASFFSTIRLATRFIRSVSPTELPPNFMTNKANVVSLPIEQLYNNFEYYNIFLPPCGKKQEKHDIFVISHILLTEF
ncbi:hypothetical protein D3C78_1807440 [compost metagenome]